MSGKTILRTAFVRQRQKFYTPLLAAERRTKRAGSRDPGYNTFYIFNVKQLLKIPKSRLEAPVDFGAVINDRRVFDVELSYTEYTFIQFSSSKIVLFDPYSAAHRYSAFDADFGPLAFPYALCCNTDIGERVAYCGLKFGEDPVTEWKPVFTGEKSAMLVKLAVSADGASVPIGSGVCAIADVDAYNDFFKHLKDENHPLSGQIVLNGQTHIEVELFGKKFAVFSTGWGDGLFHCYIGTSAGGNVMRLLIDFGMIEYPVKADEETVDVCVDPGDVYVYDPTKTEAENNIAKRTFAIETATDPTERLIAYSRRGYAYHSLGDTQSALRDYEAAAEECKRVKDRGLLLRAWPVFENAASLYCEKSDYESAIKIINTAFEIRGHLYTGAYVKLIDLYQLTKNTEKAMDIAVRMIRARPDDPVANMKYAEVCVSAMEYANAAKTYLKLADDFKLFENLFDAASCLIELGDLGGADAALERHPAKEFSEQYWYYKAYIDCKNKQYAEALIKARKSHELDGEYMPALYLLIDIETLLQQFFSVAAYAEEYKRLRPDKEYGYCVCAEAHLILGNMSECSKNYYYLYEKIKPGDEKYGALAAITAARIGDIQHKGAILKKLRKKRSSYYYGAVYAIYVKNASKRAPTLAKAVYKLHGDDDFLLQLATYLSAVEDFLPSAHILKLLTQKANPPAEVVAQQIRTACKIGDKRLFDSFFDYYISHFLGKLDENEKADLKLRFGYNEANMERFALAEASPSIDAMRRHEKHAPTEKCKKNSSTDKKADDKKPSDDKQATKEKGE